MSYILSAQSSSTCQDLIKNTDMSMEFGLTCFHKRKERIAAVAVVNVNSPERVYFKSENVSLQFGLDQIHQAHIHTD